MQYRLALGLSLGRRSLRTAALCTLLQPGALAAQSEIEVGTTAELRSALKAPPGPRVIRLRAGRYLIDTSLVVPDGVTLAGAGVMRFDAAGLPTGFEPGSETALVAEEDLQGDVVVPGDGTHLRNLRIEGSTRAPSGDRPPAGNVVMIASRRARDDLRASVSECEIVNHSSPTYHAGPSGRAVVIITRNPDDGTPWHEQAHVAATIERSIVRNTAAGIAVFAINFASEGSIELAVESNRLEGSFGVAGGASKPDEVKHARAALRSRANLFISPHDQALRVGWQIIGGSPSPHHPRARGTVSNSVTVDSADDRIEGYPVGILAAAGRPVRGLSDRVEGNRVDLRLSRLTIRTVGDAAADLLLHGALTEGTNDVPPAGTAAPKDNLLVATIVDSSGSGRRDNEYSNASGGAASSASVDSNRLQLTGSPTEFLRRNSAFDPIPAADFFMGSEAGDPAAR